MKKEWELLGLLLLTLCFYASNGQKVVCTQEAVADIVFLVDGSGSIGLENFQQIREFLSSLVNHFEVSSDKVQIGLVQYSDKPHTEFFLNTYRNKEEIINYITNLRYIKGGTNTGQGLEFLLRTHFIQEAGSRIQHEVPQIAIVITDGESQDEVQSHAQKLRESGIELFAIGIKDTDEAMLKQIASKPHSQHVYSVSDFAALKGIFQSVIHQLCTTVEVAHSEVVMTMRECNETAQADVVLVVDSSGSIGETDFAEVKTFLHAVVDKLNLREDRVRLGLIQFSHQPHPEFLLGDYLDKRDLHQKVDNLIYHKGGTNTGQALTFIRENYFNQARKNVARIAILITDGDSQDPVEEPAQKLRSQGIAIFVIKVGKGNMPKLRTIANIPHEEFVFSIDSYQELKSLQESLRKRVCLTASDQAFVPKFADLFILVDSSASRQDMNLIRLFLQRLINQLNVGKNINRIGLAQFSENVKEEFLFNAEITKAEMVTRVRSLQLRPTGQRRIGNAIEYAHTNYFNTAAGSRASEGFKQFLLVISAGESADGVVQAARSIKKDAVTVFAVGLPKAEKYELKDISTGLHNYQIVNNNMAIQVQQKIKAAVETLDEGAVTEECRMDVVADIAFIVDQSSNVRSGHFRLVRNFLKKTIRALEIENNRTNKINIKVAVILYSNTPQADVYFNTFDKKDDILRYINSISYGRGKTNTGAALKFAEEKVFTKARGSRRHEHVQQVAVVITDGKSSDDASTAAASLRRSGVTVFAVGIQEPSESDLRQIASYPHTKFVFNVENFNELNSLAQILPRTLCNDITDSIIPSTKFSVLQEGCKLTEEADIYFLLDESGSISYSDFDDMKSFIMEFLDVLEIAPDKVRVGVVKFASRATVTFQLNTYSTKDAVQKAVKSLFMEGGGTRTDLGLQEMIPLFKDAARTRGKKVRELLIVITDGKSENVETPVQVPAEELRKMNVGIYAIGVKNASLPELELIAGSKERTYYVENYDFLKHIKKEILKEICSFEACEGLLADVIFLIDGSERVDPEDFDKTKALLEFMVNKLAIGPNKIQVAVVQYSANTNEEFSLNAFDNKDKIIQEIKTIRQMMGKTHTGRALTEVLQTFDVSRGGRSSALKFLIVLTNGESNDEVTTPAKDLRDNSIDIFTIGVGNSNRSQLLDIAGSHEKLFFKENFGSLNDLSSEIVLKICNTECKRPELMDVIFLVDAAGSPNKNGFQEMKSFMSNVVSKSEVGKKRVRFGTIVYSDVPRSEFTLNQYDRQDEVQGAILNLIASGGSRNTAQALKYALTYFTDVHGGRRAKNVPQVLFLITDGQVKDPYNLADWSQTLPESEVNVIAIGTAGAQEAELKMIAGDRGQVHYVNDYQALNGLQAQIKNELCNLTKPVCEKEQADLVFLIDGSESIKPPSWEIVKQVMLGIVNELNIAPDKWRVGVAQFSDIFLDHFYLNTYSTSADVNRDITNIQQRRQGTFTWNALRRVNGYFTTKNGSRIAEGVPQNLLLITDGEATDPKDLNALASLRAKKIDITVIGVGNEIAKTELIEIAGGSDKVFIETFESLVLKKTIKKVLSQLCIIPQGQESSSCDIDIGIGFDVSERQITQPLLRPQIEMLVRAAIHSVSVSPDLCCNQKDKIETKIGYRLVSGQDGRVLKDFNFKTYSEDVVRELLLMRPAEPLAFNTFLLDSFREKFLPSNAKVKVMMLFTDGLDDSIERLMASSTSLRASGISALLIVSLEGFVDFHLLEFGRGFEYMQPLSINMLNIGNALIQQIQSVALRVCCNISCSCTGQPGARGPPGPPGEKSFPGERGFPGFPGDEGPMGERGPPGINGTKGDRGCPGIRGVKAQRGHPGNKGEAGEDGLDGVNGEQGDTGPNGISGPKGDPGNAGMKGLKGPPGPKGHSGLRGDPGSAGPDNRIRGPKGERGDAGPPGAAGVDGSPGGDGDIGDPGAPGRRGQPGLPGATSDERGDPGQRGPQGYPGQRGSDGITGPEGIKGEPGLPGVQGPFGLPGVEGSKGRPGSRGPRGLPGDRGIKGDHGPVGLQGHPGQEGAFGFGPVGPKGNKGTPGYIGFPGLEGEDGAKGSGGSKGHKGYPGTPGNVGDPGNPGPPGETGIDGHTGKKGPPGISPMPECELVEYIRDNCACCEAHRGQCPVHPTELVLALDMSTGVTDQAFEQMRTAAISLLKNINIAQKTCPWGARVSVISYSNETKSLIRFSDHHKQETLEEAIKMIPLERTAKVRDIGQAMRFMARNIFKRVREGQLMRKVAVFFTNGPSRDALSTATAMLELRAADIGLGVIALRPANDVRQAVQVDDTGSYIVVDGQGVDRIKRCIICFDRCKPDPVCGINLQPEPLQMDLDLSVLMDGSADLNTQQYLGVKELTLSLLDQIEMSSDPHTADRKTRLAFYQQSSIYGSSYIHEEFSFTQFRDRSLMKRHITNALKQVGGTSHPEFALEWMITNVLLKAETQRKKRMVVAVFGEDSEHLNKAQLDYVSKLCRCRNVVMFIVMTGQKFDWTQMEKLTNSPLEHRLVFMGSPIQKDREYARRFIYTFLHLLKRELIPQVVSQSRECDGFEPRPVEFEQSPDRDIITTAPPTEKAPEDYDVYNGGETKPFTDSYPDIDKYEYDQADTPEFKTARCFLKRDSGTVCASYEPRWYYNQKAKRCQQFWYGGCGGNENRFLTEAECFSECGSTVLETLSKDDPIISEDVCHLKYDEGTCSAYSVKWYFNINNGECLQFWYGGCKGNGNRFNTQNECESRCLKDRKASPGTS
ncbi:collagen alpha-6(VI) chain isoform X2 [Misgurnus anguillicaudatus]|uniref:collagen alpha-6(VI) chain isoform X2 n=1 Tax=Misgurnus anguillicaudatus TaxID=75329 RepID=UPI003CCF7FBD